MILKAKSCSGVVGEGPIPLEKVLWELLAGSAKWPGHCDVGLAGEAGWNPTDDSIKRQLIPCNLKVSPTPNVKKLSEGLKPRNQPNCHKVFTFNWSSFLFSFWFLSLALRPVLICGEKSRRSIKISGFQK